MYRKLLIVIAIVLAPVIIGMAMRLIWHEDTPPLVAPALLLDATTIQPDKPLVKR